MNQSLSVARQKSVQCHHHFLLCCYVLFVIFFLFGEVGKEREDKFLAAAAAAEGGAHMRGVRCVNSIQVVRSFFFCNE